MWTFIVSTALKASMTSSVGGSASCIEILTEPAINNANKYRNEKIPEASAKADQITQDAEAARQERVNEGIAQADHIVADDISDTGLCDILENLLGLL